MKTICLFTCLALFSFSTAADIVVSSNSDSGPNTLRQAIADANPGDRILFDSSIPDTLIRLDSGNLFINKDLVIDASSIPGGITIDGDRTDNGSTADDVRILSIVSATVTIENITFQNGKAPDATGTANGASGGAIQNSTNADLTLIECEFFGNRSGHGVTGTDATNAGTGGAIYNTGTLTAIRCLFTNNTGGFGGVSTSSNNGGDGGAGGAIFSFGTLILRDCEFTLNFGGPGGNSSSGPGGRGGGGGAVFASGPATIERCTFDFNYAGDGGMGNSGGIGGHGGALYNSGESTIRNSTVYSNYAGFSIGAGSTTGGRGGGIYSPNSLNVENCTIVANTAGDGGLNSNGGNGGGIYSAGVATVINLSNTIFFNNSAGAGGLGNGQGPDYYRSNGALNPSGVNFVSDNSSVDSVFPVGSPNVNGDFAGTNMATIDPLLGSLTDNGGPTRTILPLPGSPAIDPPGGVTSSPLTTDQRGSKRVSGLRMEIGAVEILDNSLLIAKIRKQIPQGPEPNPKSQASWESFESKEAKEKAQAPEEATAQALKADSGENLTITR